MSAIRDKVRHYRKTSRLQVYYALGSLAFWLSVILASLILALTAADLYVRLTQQTVFLGGAQQLSPLLFEIPLLFGMLQVCFLGAERRYRQLHPRARYVTLRTPTMHLVSDKPAYLSSTFAHGGTLRDLAKMLISEWEWRREIRNRTLEPLWRRAVGFFGLPSAGILSLI
jgi:hypothetical protein